MGMPLVIQNLNCVTLMQPKHVQDLMGDSWCEVDLFTFDLLLI